MHPGSDYSDKEIKKRFDEYYIKDPKKCLMSSQIPFYRNKWSNLSEFIKEVKQGFSRFYNKRHKRKGFFWSDRYKSVLVENGETLINCLAYIELNPIRAGICDKPEDYRWNSLGYYFQTGNSGNLVSLDWGLIGQENVSNEERLAEYRQFVYDKGGLDSEKGKSIKKEIIVTEKEKGFIVSTLEKFQYRTRYFSDSGIIGTKDFVLSLWNKFQENPENNKRKPTAIKGLKGIYSLKRLSESIF